MTWRKSFFQNHQSALVQELSVLVPALGSVDGRQIIKSSSHVRVLGAESLLANCQRTFEERLRFRVLAFFPQKHGEAAKYDGNIRVLRSERFFTDGNSTLK